MKADRFGRLKRLVLDAADLPEDERKAYLDEACKGDPELRREAESILAHGTDESGIVKTHGMVPHPPDESLIGQTISHYRILEQLGVGGMGVVYKAEDTTLKRTVALKFLPPELTRDPGAKARFLREAQAAAALDHANICTVHEIGESEGLTFIAMSYVEGRSLKEMMEAGSLKLDQAVVLSIQIAEGLKAAHDKGIVHRDVKPGNILVTSAGRAEIADFGLAKFSGRSEITTGGTRMGTVSYMSPEQARGDAVDHRTDIWSLGVMLYEMVTGQRPFRGEQDTAVVYSILNEEPEPMTSIRQGVPQELQWVVDKAMAKHPDERYQTAAEMLGDLRSLRDSQVKPDRLVATGHRPSIAVLPFVNLSGDPENEYFSDGLAEDLITALSNIQDLRVVARTSAFSFKGKDIDTREIGRRLRAETLLEGSVRRSGDRLRITAQLVNAADGYHLWSERYDRQMEDVFTIQDDISLAITDTLKVKLLGEGKRRPVKRYTSNMGAFQLYLKSRYFASLGHYREALEYCERAVAEDPRYPLAYVEKARCLSNMVDLGYLAPQKACPTAKAAARKALEIDDMVGEAWAVLGWISTWYDHDWVEAERQLRRGIDLSPNRTAAFIWYAYYLSIARRPDEAIEQARLAQEVDPVSLAASCNLGRILTWSRRFDSGIEQLQRTLEMEPDYLYARIGLGEAYHTAGMYEEAIAELQKAATLAADTTFALGWLGWAYGLSGREEEARKVLHRFDELSEKRYVPFVHKAFVHFGLGEVDQAFALAERAYLERDQALIGVRHPVMDPYRSHPSFIELCRKMGLEP